MVEWAVIIAMDDQTKLSWYDIAKIGANLIVAVGTIWLLLSGTCTAIFTTVALYSMADAQDGTPLLVSALLVGMASLVIGQLVRIGRRALHRRIARLESKRNHELF